MMHVIFEHCHLEAACAGFEQRGSAVLLSDRSSTVDSVDFTVRSFGSEETSIR